ncbi:MAG: FtsX-like permease family protein [Deltaproteobacteria bacterium]|nr:FtsX-like permease family protein [Deltaproteobacteria bacterium]
MNRLVRILSQSLRAAVALKIRTFFCTLSIAIGISAITIIVAATEGAYQKAFEIVETFGPDSIFIIGGSEKSRAVAQRQKTLTLADAEAIRSAFATAYLVVPMTTVQDVIVSYKGNRYSAPIVGTTSDYSRSWSWPVVEGSDFTDEDLRRLANVALLGHETMKQLFGEENPVGKTIRIRRIPVQVVGVLLERGSAQGGGNMDNRVIMPLSTVMRKLQNETKYVAFIRVRFEDQENLDRHLAELKTFLRRQHRLPDGEPDDFQIFSPKDIIKFLVALTGSLIAFVGIVGIISLVVAGFVLANLFHLSIRERTGEIGIRRSVGAKRRDILFQFLGEALIITTAGGLCGFLMGVVFARLLQTIEAFPIHFSWMAFAIGLFLSWLVGIIFGLRPASQAARLEPIEAIRG